MFAGDRPPRYGAAVKGALKQQNHRKEQQKI